MSPRQAEVVGRLFKVAALGLFAASLGLRLTNFETPAPNPDPEPFTPGDAFAVVIFGIDGADWRIIDEIHASGDLPNLARVRAEGASGLLTSISGPSPLIWTSIATGRRPEHHGIADLFEFFEPHTGIRVPNIILNPFVPLQDLTMTRRRIPYTEWEVKPLWTVHSERGGANLVSNWWFTLPALPIDGILVSDPMLDFSYVDCGEEVVTDEVPHSHFPADLKLSGLDRVCTMLRDATGARDELGALHTLNEIRTDIPRARSWIGQGDIVASLQTAQRIGFEIFASLFASNHFPFAAFVDTSVDMASHHFSLRVFSRETQDGEHAQVVSDAERKNYFEGVAIAYREVDAALGRVLAAADDRTVVLVVSDHGWNYDGSEHSGEDPGIIAMWGAPIRKGLELERHTVFDIAPTVLRLLGLPISAELEGAPIEEVLVGEALAELGERRVVNAYGAPDPSVPMELSADENRQYMERLRSLGYVK